MTLTIPPSLPPSLPLSLPSSLSVFGVPVRKDIIHRLVTWQRAKKRVGLASTKRVGDIRGSTKKVRPQKGGGRARAGKKQ